MKKLIVLVGPPGSGKSTEALELEKQGYIRISQDDQGKDKHHKIFQEALLSKKDIVVDRMNFSKHQRDKYLHPAKMLGYATEIIVFHVPRQTCFERIMSRIGHPTINGLKAIAGDNDVLTLGWDVQNEKQRQANSALDTFFTKYERVEDSEADKVTRLGWVEHTGKTNPAIICDLDGTLCNIDHRLHHVRKEVKKERRWDLFFKDIPNDTLNDWCYKIIRTMGCNYPIILCSGRGDNTRKDTVENLAKNNVKEGLDYRELFMRHRNDYRQDYIIKEILLEFEIKPRYQVLFSIDDRKQVVDMWRKHGITCLQCAPGDF